MLDLELMLKKPATGNKFIYRYFDDEGSYIGQTKKSLKARAGKDGKLYCKNDNKWSQAILEKGFNHFNVEILCECLESEADKKEKEFIKKFDSRRSGYNTSPGGLWCPDFIFEPGYSKNEENELVDIKQIIADMKETDIKYLCKIINKLYKIKIKDYTAESLLQALKTCNEIYDTAWYYAFEGEDETIGCSALDYLYDYLEIFPNSFAYLKYLYIENKLRQDDPLAQYHTPDLYYKKQEELLNSLTEKDIDIFLDEITECDLRTSNYKDLACGDCLSLGINIRYKF